MRYLDQHCDASPPAGHAVAEAESDFLEHAFDTDIVVRGSKLCAWAIFFWDGRGMSYQPLHSPIQKLRLYSPAMTDAEARELLATIPGAEQKILDATDLRGLLEALFPADLWRATASLRHGAHWLLWLDEQAPPAFAQSLIKVQAALWQDQLDGAEKHLYGASSAKQARVLLDHWLGIEETADATADLPEFPLPISDRLRQRVGTTWTRRTIEQRGIYFRSIVSRRIPRELKEDVARMSADYFKSHHSELESSIVQEISDFLPMEEIGALRDIVPPEVPPPPPADASLVAAWFCNSYLPYRLWAIDRDDEAVRTVCRDRGAVFAKWFLEFYPTALAAGAETISFRRSGRVMHDRAGKVTLLIILDGIGIWDAKELARLIKSGQKRLALTKNDWCFAAVPTVTEICKPAMWQWKQNERLANWVSMQRHLKKSGALPEPRVKLLEELGFKWRADHDRLSWDIRYAELLSFKESHGHCDVLLTNSNNPSLGVWVVNQRSNRKRGNPPWVRCIRSASCPGPVPSR